MEKILTEQLKLTKLQAQLLINRDITTVDEANAFLNPSRKQINSPFLFSQMTDAVTRLQKAFKDKEKIYIFGDRDVDGVAGTAILTAVFKAFGAEVDAHMPSGGEGYGISKDAVNKALDLGFKLGITVDTGIAEIDNIAYAREKGMDIIVTDHHMPKDSLPDANIIIHPGVSGETYPFKSLCGAGVAFKLAMALFEAKSPFYNKTMIFVDVETTGLNATEHEIIEIAAAKYINGVKTDEFECLLKSSGPLTEEITNITGINDELLEKEGVDRKEGLQQFLDFASSDDAIFLGYNVSFDYAFVQSGISRDLGKEFNMQTEDVLAAAVNALPALPSKKLGSVAGHLGIELLNAHRALPDAIAAAEIFYKLQDNQDIEKNMFYDRLIPLAAVATVTDMMPLREENRAIVFEGCRLMREKPPLGLKYLLEELDLKDPKGKDLAYSIGPILNAPGRLGDPQTAFKMMSASSKKEAVKTAKEIIEINERRKELVKSNLGILAALIPEQNNLEEDKAICVVAEGLQQQRI